MTTTIVAVDPAATITAAMRELYDELRAIVDRGPTDDPGLLDEIGKLTGRIRSRITRARKRALPAEEQPAQGSEQPTNSVGPATDAPTVELPRISPGAAAALAARPSVAPRGVTVPSGKLPAGRHRAGSTLTGRRVGEITVRLPKPNAVPAETGRHRANRTVRTPAWVYALVITLVVAGVAFGLTANLWAVTAAPVAGAVFDVTRRVVQHVRGETR